MRACAFGIRGVIWLAGGLLAVGCSRAVAEKPGAAVEARGASAARAAGRGHAPAKVDGAALPANATSASGSSDARGTIAVALFQAPGVATDAYDATFAVLRAEPDLRPTSVSPDDVRAGARDAADVVVFTGGRGSVQGRALGPAGRQKVRDFVERGGGYLGVCAGAYMALQGREEFHKLAIVAGRHATGDAWIRGVATVEVAPADASAPVRLHYANGPLVERLAVPGLSPYVELARFRSDVSLPRYGTHPGEMRGKPAIVASSFGRGRVLLFSPNPALGVPSEPARPELLLRAIRWAARPGASKEGPTQGSPSQGRPSQSRPAQAGRLPARLSYADVFGAGGP